MFPRTQPDFSRFYWVFMGFTGFYWVSLGFTEFVMVLTKSKVISSRINRCSTTFYWVYLVILGFNGF